MELVTVYDTCRRLGKVNVKNYTPESLEQAYSIQKLNRLNEHDIAAWKLGGTTEATRKLFKTGSVYYGGLNLPRVFSPKKGLSLPKNIKAPAGEAEVCFRLSEKIRNLSNLDVDTLPISDFVASVAPSIELPWSPFPLPDSGLKVLVADHCAAGALVIGEEQTLSMLDINSGAVTIKCSKAQLLAEGDMANVIGGPVTALRDFLKLAQQHKLELQPGQWVATGGCTPCVALPFNELITVTFGGGLGSFSFSLG